MYDYNQKDTSMFDETFYLSSRGIRTRAPQRNLMRRVDIGPDIPYHVITMKQRRPYMRILRQVELERKMRAWLKDVDVDNLMERLNERRTNAGDQREGEAEEDRPSI